MNHKPKIAGSAESATAGGAHGAGESSELSNESPSGHGAAVGQTAATAGSDRTVASAWSLPGAYRLGILQILVWTLLSAVLASLVQPGFASTPTPTSFEWHYRVFCTAHAILVGGILTAAGTLVVGRQRGQIPYWHPGHWFLIASLLGESIVLLVRLIEHWMVGTYLGYSMQLLQVLGYIPVLLVYAMALFTRDRVVWRVAYGLSLAM